MWPKLEPVTSPAIYARQSLDVAEGITRQVERCRSLVHARGWPAALFYVDNDTSASKVRGADTGWGRMLEDIRSGLVDTVVAVNLDRLLRTQRDLLDLLDLGVAVVTLEGELDLTSASGEMQASVLTAMARFETRRKSERQVRANEHRARTGKVVRGRRPFGFEPDGVNVRAIEADAVRWGYEAVADGETLAGVAREWNSRGLTPGQNRRDGTPSSWRHDNVRAVLLNPRYRGAVRRHGEIVNETAEWQALVDRALYDSVEAILTDAKRRTGGPRPARLLSGIALCGVEGCGATVHAGGGARRGVANYRCSGSLGHFARKAEPVDDFVEAVIVGYLQQARAEDGTLVLPAILSGAEGDDLAAQADKLSKRLERLRLAFEADDDADEADYLSAASGLRKRLAEVDKRILERLRSVEIGELLGSPDAAALWDSYTIERRRRILRVLPMGIVLHPPGRGVRTFDPETVQIVWR